MVASGDANAKVGHVYEYVRPSQEFLLLNPLVTLLISNTLICSGKDVLITSLLTSSAKTFNDILKKKIHFLELINLNICINKITFFRNKNTFLNVYLFITNFSFKSYLYNHNIYIFKKFYEHTFSVKKENITNITNKFNYCH